MVRFLSRGMKKLRSAWKWLKWVFVALGGATLVFLGILARGFFTEPPRPEAGKKRQVLPEPPAEVKQRAEQAYEEALIARVEATTVAEEKRTELEEIGKIDDGAERRKRLAEMLRRL